MHAVNRIIGAARRLGDDRRGGVAVWFGVMCIPLLFFAGAGMDLARGFNQKTSLQGAVDSAALAGAGAYTGVDQADAAKAVADAYMAAWAKTNSVQALVPTSTPGLVQSGGKVVAFTMTVKATSTIQNTLMQMTKGSNAVAVTATAQNPAFSLTINMAGFSSSAIDSNSISYYVVPSDGSVPTATIPLYTNTGTGPSSGSLVLPATASQSIGFMLVNKTNGNATQSKCTYLYGIFKQCTQGNDYGTNQYGGQSQSVHYFYSHMMPPSKVAYPGVTQNCSLQVIADSSAQPAQGCTPSLPQFATVNYVQAAGKVLHYYWNDMGGTTDDKDFNDAAYTVACAQAGSGAQSLSLVQ